MASQSPDMEGTSSNDCRAEAPTENARRKEDEPCEAAINTAFVELPLYKAFQKKNGHQYPLARMLLGISTHSAGRFNIGRDSETFCPAEFVAAYQRGHFLIPKETRSSVFFHDSNKLGQLRHSGPKTREEYLEITKGLKRIGTEPGLHSKTSWRRILVSNPGPGILSALLLRATQWEATILPLFFWNHFRGIGSAEAKLAHGARILSQTFHVPYPVWREAGKFYPDERRRKDNNAPWRASTDVSFLLGPGAANGMKLCLYECQVSVAIAAYNKDIWTAYCLHDPHNLSDEPQESHELPSNYPQYEDDEEDDEEDEDGDEEDQDTSENVSTVYPDPLSIGVLELMPVMKTHEYYMLLFKAWIEKASGEWFNTAESLRNTVRASLANSCLSPESQDLSLGSTHARTEAVLKRKEYLNRCNGTLTYLKSMLRRTTNAYDNVMAMYDEPKMREAVYNPDASNPDHRAFVYPNIQTSFRQLKEVSEILDDLTVELQAEHQDLQSCIGMEGNRSIYLLQWNVTIFEWTVPVVIASGMLQAGAVPPGPQLLWFFVFAMVLAIALVAAKHRRHLRMSRLARAEIGGPPATSHMPGLLGMKDDFGLPFPPWQPRIREDGSPCAGYHPKLDRRDTTGGSMPWNGV